MRRVVTVVALACLAMAVLAEAVSAQDERPARDRRTSFRGQVRSTPAQQKAAIDKAVGQLDLNDEQKEKVKKVQADFAEKFKAQEEKNKEKEEALQKEIAAAREASDREKMTTLMQQRRELMVAGTELVKEYTAALKKELNEEQAKKLDQLMLPPVPVNALLATAQESAEALKLSEEQTAAVKKLAGEYREGQPARTDTTDYRKKMQELRESGAKQEDIEKAQKEMRDSWTKRREEATKRDEQFREKLMKILNEKQRTQLEELARKRAPAGRRTRTGATGERPTRTNRNARPEQNPAQGGEEKKTDDSSF